MSYKAIKEFIQEFKEPFDYRKVAKQRLKDNGDSATKDAVEAEILIMKKEYKNKADRGTAIHKKIQTKKTKTKSYIVEGWEKSVKGSKPDLSTNTLKNNTSYIEKKILSEKYQLVGYADEVEVKNNFINIEDTKTTKKIYRNSAIRTKTGFLLPPKFYYSPIDKLQDCNFNDAALQMSLYMYILWLHNKHLKPGKLHIRHVKTTDKDDILEEELIEVPYLLEEVKKLLKHRLKNGLS